MVSNSRSKRKFEWNNNEYTFPEDYYELQKEESGHHTLISVPG